GAMSIDGIGGEATAQLSLAGGPPQPFTVIGAGYGGAMRDALAALREKGQLDAVGAVGHRVVHGGPKHSAPAFIDVETLQAIREATELAPLHNKPALEAIEACREARPLLPMVAAFDTGFFRDLPRVAATYALPAELSAKLGIRRYGFHGLAHEFMARRYRELAGSNAGRLVTLQLGSGASAAAIRDGRPIDTSMGFTPLEGLVMRSRSGDIDASLPGFIASRTGKSMDEVEALLNEESGLAGLYGGTGDVRELLRAESAGDEKAALALAVFCYRVRKYIGAYAAALGGLDGLVFGGGIGEKSPEVRRRVLQDFGWLGLDVDATRNADPSANGGLISAEASRVRCFVVEVDEARVIAEKTLRCLKDGEGQ
ncbi:MAG TPA: acetate/propionate family kinase, partial [Dehalococcoidia bacterium]